MTYALKYVPKEKISLGIAVYAYHWYTGNPGLDKPEKKPNVTADYTSYSLVKSMRDTYGAKQEWDEVDHTPWFYFYRDQMREWVFFTDQRAYNDRYLLAQENGLAGVCSWVLGEEDPAIWEKLPDVKR